MTFDMPYITIVGGTELNLSAGTYLSESAWRGAAAACSAVLFPDWQGNANPANPKLSAAFRNVPDVAMPANGIYIVFSTCDNKGLPGIGGVTAAANCTGNVQCTTVPDGKGGMLSIYTGCKAGGETRGTTGIAGGTSASTPLWAAFMALANQKNQAQGGSASPTLRSTRSAGAQTTRRASATSTTTRRRARRATGRSTARSPATTR